MVKEMTQFAFAHWTRKLLIYPRLFQLNLPFPFKATAILTSHLKFGWLFQYNFLPVSMCILAVVSLLAAVILAQVCDYFYLGVFEEKI